MLEYTSDKLIQFSYTLSKIHKYALPNAVRFTLNDAAKDVKFNTLKKHANKEFTVRKPSFFRANSAYQNATGNNIGKMQSIAGMTKSKDPNSRASTDIAKQQTGGKIENKSFMPSENQRTSSGLVSNEFIQTRKLKPYVGEKGYKFGKGRSRKSDFVARAYMASKENKPLLYFEDAWDKGVLYKVSKFRKLKNGRPKFSLKKIAYYKPHRAIELKNKHYFMNNAALESGKSLDDFFVKNAKKQIEKLK